LHQHSETLHQHSETLSPSSLHQLVPVAAPAFVVPAELRP